MVDWMWNTDDMVDAAVQRALDKSREVFLHATKPYNLQIKSQLCDDCNSACRVTALDRRYSERITWSKTRKDFARATSSAGCHLCIIIAHAFDKSSINTFATMGPDEVLQLHFTYHTAERDPSGKLDWEQRTRMPISNITLDAMDIPDEFWLTICPKGESKFDKLRIDLRMRRFEGENIQSSQSSALTKFHSIYYRRHDGDIT